jgi:hypothetical protein
MTAEPAPHMARPTMTAGSILAEPVTGPSRYEYNQQGSDRRGHQRELNGDTWEGKILRHRLDEESEAGDYQKREADDGRDGEGDVLLSMRHLRVAL